MRVAMPAWVAQPGVLTVGRHQQPRLQAAAVRKGQLRRIVAEADRLAAGRGQHSQVRLSPQRPPQGGAPARGSRRSRQAARRAHRRPRTRSGCPAHRRTPASPATGAMRSGATLGPGPVAREKGLAARADGIDAHVPAAGFRSRLGDGAGARSTRARLSPLPSRARARLNPTSPPPMIATSNCIRVRCIVSRRRDRPALP